MTDRPKSPILHWIVFGLGCVAIVLMIGIFVWEYFGNPIPEGAPPGVYSTPIIAELVFVFAFFTWFVMVLFLILIQSHKLELQRKVLEDIHKELKVLGQRDDKRETASD